MAELTIEEARALAGQRLSRLGAPPEQVRDAVEVCLDAELRGRASHGLRLLRHICAEYGHGADRRTAPRWVHDTPVSGLLDGGFALSVHGHVRAMRAAVAKARDTGLALCGVRDAGVSGALGYYVRVPAEQGFLAVALNTTPSTVVPPGTATALLGTNPLAIGVPQRAGPPVVLDMATSAVAFNTVLMARAAGTPLPPAAAVDAAGRETRDPAEAVDADGRGRLLPFGGHRGYGLALLVELLVGALTGAPVGAARRGPVVLEPSHFAGLYLVLRADLLGDGDGAVAAATALVEQVRALDPSAVLVPGDRSERARAAALAAGTVRVPDEVVAFLRS